MYFKLIAAVAFAYRLTVAAPANAPFRVSGFDVGELPKVLAPLDFRRPRSGGMFPVAGDYRLIEDGKPTVTASRSLKLRDTDVGLALIVALDTSGSMKGRPMNAIRQGLAQLVPRKRDQDRVAVLSFADDIRWETTWNASQTAVQDAFRNMQTRGNKTRLFDAVAESITELAMQSGKDKNFPLRQCILLISDGHDEGSQIKFKELLTRVGDSRVRIDTIGLTRVPLWLGSMRELSTESFGEFQAVRTPEALTAILGKGVDLLLDLPVLEFAAQNLTYDGNTHQIGAEQISTRVRDRISQGLANRPLEGLAKSLKDKWVLWAAGGLMIILLCGAVVFVARRKPAPASVSVSSPAASIKRQAATPPRAPTMVEPSTPNREHSRVFTEAAIMKDSTLIKELPAADQAPSAVKPVRAGTVLAPQPAASASPMALLAKVGPYAGQRFIINQTEFWIGSGQNNHLCLAADSSISGNHACIRKENRFYRLYDNNSLNNTWVNGNAIGREAVVLKEGDQLSLGQSVFGFQS